MNRMQAIEALIERDGFTCYLCEVEFTKSDLYSHGPRRITIDHVIPRSKGGNDDMDNYGLAHFSCNQEKADRMFLPDGTLEPKHSREASQAARRAQKRQILDRFCTECYGGRLLDEDEVCPYCDSPPGPNDKWPWWSKRDPKECTHQEPEWCFMCVLGFIV